MTTGKSPRPGSFAEQALQVLWGLMLIMFLMLLITLSNALDTMYEALLNAVFLSTYIYIVTIPAALYTDNKFKIIISKILYLLFNVAIITPALIEAKPLDEHFTVFINQVYVIGFPIAHLLVKFAISPFHDFLREIHITNQHVTISLFWVLFLLAGYLQWFVVLPVIVKKIKNMQ